MPPKRTRVSRPVDSSEESNDSTRSGTEVSSSSKPKATARKSTSSPSSKNEGRPRKSKQQRIQAESDNGEESETPSEIGEENANASTDQNSDLEATQPTTSSAPTPKRRGRPPKSKADSVNTAISNSSSNSLAPTSKRRGRPPGSRSVTNNELQASGINIGASTSQNRRNDSDSGSNTSSSDYAPADNSKKRKPKKNGTSFASSQRKKNGSGLSVLENSRLSQNVNDSNCDIGLVESLAQKCVYFLLIEDQKKYAIKRKAIVQHVFKDENYSPKVYGAVLCEANKILNKTFGLQLLVLENQKDGYLLVNALKRELGVDEYVDLSQQNHQQRGFILYLLTMIFMNGNSITEDDLAKALKPLRIDLSSKRLHPIFGDVKKYITIELVKQMYVTYECINKDPPQYELQWGLRAKQEVDKRDLLRFAAEVLDTEPEDWILQNKDAEESANPSVEA